MARGNLKSLAVLLALLPAPASAQTCLQEGMAYEGGQQVIAPGYVRNAKDCQFQCAMTLYCAYFTWKVAPNTSLGLIGPGGCLKFNDQATLVPVAGPASETVSGSSACPSLAPTLAPSAANGTIPSAPAAAPHSAPAGPATAAPEVLGATQLPTGKPTEIAVQAPAVATEVNGLGAAGDDAGGKGSGGGFPWWAVLLVAFAVMGVGAVVVLFGMGGGSGKGKKSKRPKKSVREEEEEDSPEVQALMRAEAPQPMAEPTDRQMAAPAGPLPQLQGFQAPGQAGFPQQPQQEPVFRPQGQTAVMQPQGAAFVQLVPMQQMAAMQRPQLR